jgi:DNA repair photolyase
LSNAPPPLVNHGRMMHDPGMPSVDITETTTKSALVRSRIPSVEYVINPYTGCAHGCRYCYAMFMARYSKTHQRSPWGTFVEAKVNIEAVLRAELSRKRRTATAMLSSVCDPYQPAEARYKLTQGCIKALREYGWGVSILTRSPLVTRDIDLLRTCLGVSVGFSIPTDDDQVRQILEPEAPSIPARLAALRELYEAGIHTWVFIAPTLPMNPERLGTMIAPYISEYLIDPLNYKGQVASLFHHHGWDNELTAGYARSTVSRLHAALAS